ncbi:type I polyketide synthase [Synechococcus sp. CBW1004]|uniref:type I polyketide synthase n=1 Tax=Synechococcus sp. CBW1004 TaxID=1353136 RepID=UPI0018CF8126|nr:type I polyketide synthase [Synechococcus sp. CBW1004]
MPESPLDGMARQWMASVNGQEALLLGERLGQGCRVLSRPGLSPVEALRAQSEELEIADLDASERSSRWRRCVDRLVGWRSVQECAWPVGQSIGLAAPLLRHHRTTGRLIRALHVETERALRIAAERQPLAAGSELALSHGTTYPIVQGPMTRVSDSAGFAEQVALAGGLPMLALALMQGSGVRALLAETRDRLQGRPWGVGVLGFVPQQLRAEQMEVVREFRPPFALIAGGRPDQALQLEAEGIATYLHVPTASLLELFLEQGARRFVFEGRECGGHVGPLSSFVLWESAIAALLEGLQPEQAHELHILFAGGIHDARSASMVAALAAPLVLRGVKVGVLLGTAYLFTQECVSSGAIAQSFQDVALACTETINLETGPGHASRCAITPFATEFYETQRSLRRERRSPEDIKNSLEDLTLGRLRVASKGVVRQGGELQAVAGERQLREGMYMLGQVATLRSEVTTVSSLHADISGGSSERLARAARWLPAELGPESPPPLEDIAIIGIGTLLPEAQVPAGFWRNIVAQSSALREIPANRWDWRLYYDSDRDARDRIYSRWGGFLDDVTFDPMDFGIPPRSMRSIEPMQLLTLEVVRRALLDADCGPDSDFDREHTSVILGAGGGVGDLGQQYAVRTGLPLVVEQPDPRAWERLPEWDEESFPGLLLNVAAGRVANRFDLGGSNYIVDAACASSLAALSLAVKELQSGRSNLAIAGGVDTVQNPLAYMCFSKTQALSPSGVPRPFDSNAEGITIAEGLAVVVLKRRRDAERDGDRIYAIIKAVEGSSDGRGLGMTAPRSEGQQRAVQRACAWAQVPAQTLGLYEAHGTGTMAGDRAELETINTILSDAGAAANACVVGSVKALIGHTKATAGIAGVIKAALSLYHAVRPGHAAAQSPLAPLRDPGSPVCLLPEARPWLDSGHPRRAGVSAFGFGGTNFHAVLEEYRNTVPAPVGADLWPQELLVWRSRSIQALTTALHALSQALQAGATPRLCDLAHTCAGQFEAAAGEVTLAIVASDLPELQASLAAVLAHLDGSSSAPLAPTIQFNPHTPAAAPGLAFLFPGQGSQYPGMATSPSLYFPEFRRALVRADREFEGQFPQPLSQYIFPPGAYDQEALAAQKQQLSDTRVAQPALGAIELGYLAFVRRLGISASAVCGHSFGEYAALHAAGVLAPDAFLRLSSDRGRIMAAASSATPGGMAVIQAPPELVLEVLAGRADVVIANRNAPAQTVISGDRGQIQDLIEQFTQRSIPAFLLPVSGAFHSPLMASASADLAAVIAEASLATARIPVFSNTTCDPYPEDIEAIRAQLAQHVVSPVNFVGQIEALHASGITVFLELGPRNVLADLTDQILSGRPATVVSLDRRAPGLSGLFTGLAQLLVAGVPLKPSELHRGRAVRSLNLNRLLESTGPRPLPATAWLIDGGSARPHAEPASGRTGLRPKLTLEETQAARAGTGSGASAPGPGLPTTPPALQPPGPLVPQAGPAASPLIPEERPPSPAPIQITLTPVTRSTLSAMHPSNGLSQPGASSLPPIRNPGDVSAVGLPAMSGDARLAGLQSHQETMRQFLASQERVMSHFLGGTPAAVPISTAPSAVPIAAAVPPTRPARAVEARPSPPVFAAPAPVHSAPRPAAPPPAAPSVEPVVAAAAAVPVAAPEPAAPAAAVSATAPELDRARIAQLLLELVSDRTGYPTDMLGLDKDIEADLGIDSIKRVEVLGNLRKSLPDVLAPVMQGQMETLSRLKTLDGIIDRVVELAQEAGCLGKPSAAASPSDWLPRFQMQAVHAPRGREAVPLRGVCLLTEDQLGVADRLAGSLETRGATVVRLSVSTLAEPSMLTAAVEAARRQGPIAAVVHLAPLQFDAPADLAEWTAQTRLASVALFQLLQLCAADLQAVEGARLLSVSGFGGQFGRSAAATRCSAAAGGQTGLLKTLAQEWPDVCCRVVDCDPTVPSERLSEQLLAELECLQGPVEIGLQGEERLAFQTVSTPLAAPVEAAAAPLVPAADWVVLATGGHRGITAETLKSITVPGMTLVIVGRTPEPGPEAASTAGLSDRSDLRRTLLEQARSQGDTPSPVAIERQLNALLAAREIRANLAHFRQTCHVDYRSLDVTDGAALDVLITDLQARYGRLDAVIQGAGAIADKLLVDKNPQAFEQVFDTKTVSAFVLQKSLRFESLKLLVFFSSVAGRYGSRGQSDYAAANEILNRLAWQLHWQHPGTRIVAINWGPWDSTGMASEEVKRQFRERGIIPIPLPEGCDYFRQELLLGSFDAVEVIAGEGPWSSIDPVGCPAQEMPRQHQGETPLLQEAPSVQPDSRMGAEWQLDPRQPFLADHRIDGTPVLAAAVAAEALAEFVHAAWPEYALRGLRDVRVLSGVTVPPEGVSVRLLARASSHADPMDLEVLAEMIDPVSRRFHYRSVVHLSQRPAAPPADLWEPLTGTRCDAGQAYREFLFHGPCYQRIVSIDAISPDGIDAMCSVSSPAAFLSSLQSGAEWLLDPGLIDVVPQLAIVWARALHDTTPLPSRIGQLTRFRPPASEHLLAQLRIDRFDGSGISYRARLSDRQGVCFELTDFEGSCSQALNRLAQQPVAGPS